ncbi:MAG TPA: glycosyltransferase family 2 protein [Parvularcula sp.]|nr:glycosyltransferase family 2 protein [Parvularcula sp.]HBS32077.1 glycosyltransferase family 2 protein [Parvularcula sp.]HBS36136.1 glycosyltransferase family 2 protein [Parvularcula sp.]
MSVRAPLSAFIRTKNEARMIGDVVTAALAVADEVVVVDSGSTDDTVALAEAAGARVVRQAWLGNGRQKRFAEDQCRHDWLLDLDADEVVTPALAAEIAVLFAAGAPPARIYRTPVAIAPPVGEPWLGFGGVIRRKLYDRRAVRAPDHEAWDQFDIPPGEPVGALTAPILHYAFTDARHLIDKLNRNSSTRAEALEAKPLPMLVLRIFFGLPFYVGKRYLLDGLFRGGVYGFAFSMMSGFGRWMRDVKMYERVMRERRR